MEDFFEKVEKKFGIDIRQDWILFSNKSVCFCTYMFVNKPRKGDVCGKRIKQGDFCSLHKPKVKVVEKVKEKVEEKVKEEKVKEKVEVEKVKEKVVKEEEKVKEVKVKKAKEVKDNIIRYIKGRYIHLSTKFVFSKETKSVCGKLSMYDTVIPLCDKDIELCKKYRFKII